MFGPRQCDTNNLMPRKQNFKFGLNEKQAGLWADKLMDVANLVFTGVLLTQGFTGKINVKNIGFAFIIYILIGILATYLRR